ncbi:MAG TPA: M13 family metallopeptidase N-terminal domain-containing protein, partial [Candidatus Polarisedimenticolia bacterium]|nr:M13 family metallopeptidase N-terminal domain-containing protein [Candidatus Polarisedimenticolia bacterium]
MTPEHPSDAPKLEGRPVPAPLPRRAALPLLLILAAARCGHAGDAGARRPAAPNLPAVPVAFDLGAIDRSVEPCADFYRFACGSWIAKNPIPPDQGAWGRFSELEENNLAVLRGILEKAAVPDPSRGPDVRMIGDYYAACMDESSIEAKGLAPIKPDLDAIAALGRKGDLAPLVARLQMSGANTVPGDSSVPSLLFGFESGQDFKDATSVIAQADQGGLGLPGRDYYLKDDAKTFETRKAYEEHVRRTLGLLGDPPEAAAAGA